MADLTKRLRQLEVTICHEAADEIKQLRAKLKTAINIIKYAQRRGFEGPADPMEVINAAGRDGSVSQRSERHLVDSVKKLPKGTEFYCVNCDETMTVETLREIECGLDDCPIFKSSPIAPIASGGKTDG